MYNLQKNNYRINPKSSIVYTPKEVSQFIFNLLTPCFPDKEKIIFDSCCGTGNLLVPWKNNGYRTFGIDIDQSLENNGYIYMFADFLQLDKPSENGFDFRDLSFFKEVQLVLCNPPFNGYGKQLASEVWLAKIIKLFGKDIPLVLFVPMGFRLNSKKSGKRWTKFTNQEYPSITSIISLPRDIFAGVEFHSEILIFNLPNLQPHYFYHHEI